MHACGLLPSGRMHAAHACTQMRSCALTHLVHQRAQRTQRGDAHAVALVRRERQQRGDELLRRRLQPQAERGCMGGTVGGVHAWAGQRRVP